MESNVNAEMWLNMNEEDPDAISAAYEGVKGLFA